MAAILNEQRLIILATQRPKLSRFAGFWQKRSKSNYAEGSSVKDIVGSKKNIDLPMIESQFFSINNLYMCAI
jgi:hypothetical protein